MLSWIPGENGDRRELTADGAGAKVTTRDNGSLTGPPQVDPTSTSNGDEAEAQAIEQRRLQARRRFLKGGMAGSTAMILTLHHVPVEANWTDGDWNSSSGDDKNGDNKYGDNKYGKKKTSTMMCDEPTWKRKRGVSICTSLNGQVAKKHTW